MSYFFYPAVATLAPVFVPQVTNYAGSPPPPPPPPPAAPAPAPTALQHYNITYIGSPAVCTQAVVPVSMPIMQMVTTNIPFATFAMTSPAPPGVYTVGLPLRLAP
ncbi:hypothetical protein BT67DRAFT_456055 [Trichocladium antarcticum]|uniref:Uncharacterized protein n=1 Tax=Trichocladium antarcticum TaxID=1450529 RepID=A0AAN6UJY2_9PEZI|nr:hypothetical protein BT67DRAFT_456055 [Trichocladium antarcticum]